MNDPLIELQAAMETMRGEMEKMKKEMALMRKAVQVSVDKEDGSLFRVLTCDVMQVKCRDASGSTAITLSASGSGGCLSLMYPENPDGSASAAVNLMLNEDGEPELVLRGRDLHPLVMLKGEPKRGSVAVFSEAGQPGAVMHGQAGGGSVAVLQPDGKARGVLIHSDGAVEGGRTELIFVDEDMKTRLKLLADPKHELLHLAHPEVPQAVVLAGGKEGGSLQMNAALDGSSISLMATGKIACLTVKEGLLPEPGAEVHLSAGEGTGCAVSLSDSLGGKRAELHVTGDASMLSLNGEGETAGVELMHMAGNFSSIKLHAPSGQRTVNLMATNDLGAVSVRSPEEEGTAVSLMTNQGVPSLLMTEQGQGRVLINTTENCGMVCAYGPRGNEGGMASLCGGERSGAVRVGAADGTTFAMMSATDHGGRLDINNDLGLPRIVMGVHQESAGIHLNHTGSVGVSAVATEIGGVVSVHDDEGNRVASLPAREEED